VAALTTVSTVPKGNVGLAHMPDGAAEYHVASPDSWFVGGGGAAVVVVVGGGGGAGGAVVVVVGGTVVGVVDSVGAAAVVVVAGGAVVVVVGAWYTTRCVGSFTPARCDATDACAPSGVRAPASERDACAVPS
jgi:hypothetical protein